MTIKLKTLTQGALRDILQCEELFRLKRLARLRSPDFQPPLATGSSVHHGIEVRCADAARRHYLRSRNADMLTDFDLRDARMGAAQVYAMVTAALARWGDDWPQRQEGEFALDFVNPATGGRSTRHIYRGVIDGWPDAAPLGARAWVGVLGEWKTAASPNEAYFDRLKLDWQVSAYCEAASRVLGVPVREVRYRVIQKPTIRPRRGEDEATYRQRCADRKPLALVKPLTLKEAPKGRWLASLRVADGAQVDAPHGVDVGQGFPHRGTLFVRAPNAAAWGPWVEEPSAYAARCAAREAARAPLARKVPETVGEYTARLGEWYAANLETALTEERVTRTEGQMERWRYEAWELHRRALAIERAHNASLEGRNVAGLPIRNDSRCTQYGSRCQFLSLCSGLVGPDAYQVTRTPYPELKDGAHHTDTNGDTE